MSSTIEINIHTHGDTEDEVGLQKHLGLGQGGEDSVPAPPSEESYGAYTGSASGLMSAEGDAPAPPADEMGAGDHDADMGGDMAAGPPDVSASMPDSDEMASSMDADGDPMPPMNHPDIAGDDTAMAGAAQMQVSAGSGKPGPPADVDMDEKGKGEDDDKGGGSKSKSKGKGKKKK